MTLFLLIIIGLLVFGGGGYYGHRRWGRYGAWRVMGSMLLVLLVLYLLGGLNGWHMHL